MKGIIGKKLGMTQIFNEKGLVVPVTVIEAGPCTVVQNKTDAIDGYNASVLAFEDVKEARLNKAELGVFKKAGVAPKKYLREFSFETALEVGAEVKADIFNVGDKIDVSGVTRGRGFTGNIQRWNAHRLNMTHGAGPVHREVGSMGANSTPARVLPGKKMPGQYGNENVTVQNLEIVKIDLDKNVILVKGAIPGKKGSLVTLRETVR